MHRVIAVVQRGPMEAPVVNVPPYELEILKAIYGEDAIQPHDEAWDDTPARDPESEYERLANRYGVDLESKRPWVEIVYGRLTSGHLAGAIRAASHGSPSPEGADPRPGLRIQPSPQSGIVEDPDFDGNKWITRGEIIKALTAMEIPHNPNARKPELVDLYRQACKDALDALEVNYEEEAGLKELLDLVRAAGADAEEEGADDPEMNEAG